MTENLAIIGASYLQLPLILKAKSLGYVTHVFAWKANDVGETEADFFYPISIVEKEKILEKCIEIGIVGICSIASDVAVVTVNYVAEKLNLCGNPISSTLKCTNKHCMRMAFAEENLPSPLSFEVEDNADLSQLEINYPVIVKPTDRSGSRGIYKVTNYTELESAVVSAQNESFENKALIEEFVDGDEFSVEYISFAGEHYFLTVTKKYTTGAPHFIETGHLQPANVSDDILRQVQEVIPKALTVLGIKNGASHSEFKINSEGQLRIIEIGARMGGDCIGSDLVQCSTGYDFIKMVIDVACGRTPDFTKTCEPFSVEVVFIFSNDDIAEFERMRYEEPERIVKIVDYHPERIGSITDSSNRAGCYIKRVGV